MDNQVERDRRRGAESGLRQANEHAHISGRDGAVQRLHVADVRHRHVRFRSARMGLLALARRLAHRRGRAGSDDGVRGDGADDRYLARSNLAQSVAVRDIAGGRTQRWLGVLFLVGLGAGQLAVVYRDYCIGELPAGANVWRAYRPTCADNPFALHFLLVMYFCAGIALCVWGLLAMIGMASPLKWR
ncbi:MAG: hypothetical protein M3R20_07675 [Pseudomonadota bacterium]|nr:hypothetical protein [Pseudomonadota bacterium]